MASRLKSERLFRCAGCKQLVSWDKGAADDMPEHCDDCWAKAHGFDVKCGIIFEREGERR